MITDILVAICAVALIAIAVTLTCYFILDKPFVRNNFKFNYRGYGMSKVKNFERFTQGFLDSDDCDLQEIGEELEYFVRQWKQEIGYKESTPETDEAGILKRPDVKLDD